MSKIKIDQDLVRRLKNAASNGSTIASKILEAIANETPLKSKNANNFTSCRVVSHNSSYDKISIKVYCCNKDMNGKHPDSGNPCAVSYSENRTELSVTAFAKLFVNEKDFTPAEWDYLENIISVNCKVKIKMGSSVDDFIRAYDTNNYARYADSSNSTLHGSCMQHDHCITNVADFYSNFCGASILYAEGDDGCIYGRAVVWKRVYELNDKESCFSLLERVYCCFSSIRTMIINKATELGIVMRKAADSYDTPMMFHTLNPYKEHLKGENINNFTCFVRPKFGDNYKCGTAYTDTFDRLVVLDDYDVVMINSKPDGYLRDFRNTSNRASGEGNVCPICGNITHDKVCHSCISSYAVDTYMGRYIQGQFRPYHGVLYPPHCFEGDKPKVHLLRHLCIEKTSKKH